MKKIFNIGIPIIILVGFVALSIYVFSSKRIKELSILNVPYDYFYQNDTDELNMFIPIYVNEKDSVYFNKESINRSTLQNIDESMSFRVDVMDITSTDSVTYNNITYYLYECELRIPFEIDSNLYIDNMYLKLDYDNDEEILMHIGSLCIYNNTSTQDVTYTSLKGVVQEVSDNIMLSHVLVKLYSTSPYTIKNITPISNYASISWSNTYKVDYLNEYETPLNEIVSSNYDVFNQDNSIHIIEMNNESYLLIALNYKNINESNTIGFNITYEQDGETKELVISPFKFFSTNNMKVEEQKYEFNRNM